MHDTLQRFQGLHFLWNNVGHPGPAAFEDLDLAVHDQAMLFQSVCFLPTRGGFARSGMVSAPRASMPARCPGTRLLQMSASTSLRY